MFHMTNDSDKFKTREELESEGFYPVEGNKLKKGEEEFLPLYVGRMIYQYNHRASSVEINASNIQNVANSRETEMQDLVNPEYYPDPQYWVSKNVISPSLKLKWHFSFRDVSNPTNERSLISAIIPNYPVGNTLPILIPENEIDLDNFFIIVQNLIGNFNSFAFDFIARQKMQGQHINWYILEQIPVIPNKLFSTMFGDNSAREIIHEEVLRLTYTAWDLKDFAKDMGYEGEPFIWDEEDRIHRKARLDALFFYCTDLPRRMQTTFWKRFLL